MASVSVIVTCYNKAKFIKETISSVLRQTANDWELIIVDDASTDDSVSIVKELAEDKRVKLIVNGSNKGANFSRNLGLKLAVGQYIVFLDGDDILTNNCLERRMNIAQNSPGYDFYIFDMGVFNDQIGDDKRVWRPKSKDPLKDFLIHKLPWAIMQPLWNRDFLLQINGFDEDFSRLQDVELSTRALMQTGVKFKIVNGYVDCYYRIKQNRIVSIYQLMDKWVNSCDMYCKKFNKLLLEIKYHKFLLGTIVRTHLQLIHYYRVNEITHDELVILEKKLYDSSPNLTAFQMKVIKTIRYFNLKGYNIPGFNYLGISLLIKLS